MSRRTPPSARPQPRRDAPRSSLRIIGGQWRSRKLPFTSAEGLRPTGDRIRETLFNWLAPHIAGARCLDLFAGSGALGLEALSRGASHCDFVELNPASARQIEQHLHTLQCDDGKVHISDAAGFLGRCESHYDIVFLDPPFNKGLIDSVAPLIGEGMRPGGLMYVETGRKESIALPDGWDVVKQKTSGDVAYGLWELRREE